MSLVCPSIVLAETPFAVPSTNVVKQDVHVIRVAHTELSEEVDIDDLLATLEEDVGFHAEMVEARTWLAADLPKDLASLRLSRGLSQAQLAKEVGLQQPNISAIESGKRKPEYETARRIAAVLGVSAEEIYLALESTGVKA